MHSSVTEQFDHEKVGVGRRLASAGFGVFGMDYEGHGRSKGARCYIKKFSNIVNDCDDFFKSICEATEEYCEKSRFVYGESMGGAVALLLHRKDPSFWNGAVLVAPMCKISEEVKPHPVVINLLTTIEELIPKWKIVPAKDVIDSAFKDPVKREEVNLPFLVLHGEDDTVTDPGVSIGLYETASSRDKTLKLYPGMWHGLTSGEPDGNIDMVFADIVAWLESHTILYPMPGTPAHAIVNQSSNWTGQRGFKNGLSGRRSSRPHPRASILCGLKGRSVLNTH
ncbi:Caffeoylshikimate esterase [Nymphaea thermarum]|nr:Caffeoylshikimate esterase [Nymphaea thermarum]